MSATLESLPEEILLSICRSIAPTSLRGIFSASRMAVYEVVTPEFQALRSLRLTSTRLSRSALDALSEAEAACNTLEFNVFHLRGGSRFRQRIPDVVFQSYTNLTLTLPVHFVPRLGPHSVTDAHALCSCTLKFTREQPLGSRGILLRHAATRGPRPRASLISDHAYKVLQVHRDAGVPRTEQRYRFAHATETSTDVLESALGIRWRPNYSQF